MSIAIQHLFRVPEKRPPKVISTTFTALVLVPFVVMLIVVGFLSHQ